MLSVFDKVLKNRWLNEKDWQNKSAKMHKKV